MQYVNSSNNKCYCRSTNKKDITRKKIPKKVSEISTYFEVRLNGSPSFTPRQAMTEGPGFNHRAISNSIASSQDSLCTTLPTTNDNTLSFFTIAQLLDVKFTVDPAIPKELHKGLKCEEMKKRIQQTAEIFPPSEGPIRRVLEHPSFDGVVCTTLKELGKKQSGGVGVFNPEERRIHLGETDQLAHHVISHEFIHADYFFRHTTAPFNADAYSYVAMLPFYPGTEENIHLYKMALDEGDKRVDNFRKIKQKKNSGEILSTQEYELFKKYEDASQGSLTDYVLVVRSSQPEYHSLMKLIPIQEQAGGVRIKMYDLEVEVEVLNFSPGKLVRGPHQNGKFYVRFLSPGDLVCVEIAAASKVLEDPMYRDSGEEAILFERDAYTFQKLSESARQMFYPEANEMRTSGLELSGLKLWEMHAHNLFFRFFGDWTQ
ncbi:MAG: hypothetical protein K0R08_1269 [Solimicrobium sp.]|nr:hypothetical protein [Solimicrobium sp.]